MRRLNALIKVIAAGRRVPLHASWIVTSRCNLRCSYCDRPDSDPGELTPEQALRLVDDLGRTGCAYLSITGGEPLVREDLPVIMARARFHRIRMNVNTNGLLVAERLDVLRLADAVVISLDGPPETHDAIRGRGAWAGAMKGAEAAKNAGLPVSFYCVIGRTNVDNLEYLVERAKELGSRVFFQPGARQVLGSGCGENKEAAGPDAYRRAILRLIEWKRRGRPVGNSLAALRYLQSWPEPKPIRCMGARLFVRIDSDGQARPCGRVERGPDNSVLGPGGVVAAMGNIPEPDCSACFSAARVQVNLMAAGSPGAIWSFLRS